MTRRALALGVAVVVILALGVGLAVYALHHGGGGSQAHGAAPAGGTKVRVLVVKPQQGGVERTVTRPGTVHSFQYADLYAKVSGFLQHQVVDIGDRVQKDQVLAEVFAPEITANVRKAEADLKKARSLVDVMKARVQEARADLQEARMKLEQTRADLESARALVKLRQQQYHRIKSLAEMSAIEQELVDEKYEARQAAQASERSTSKAVATAEAGVTAAEAAVKRAQANESDAEAQVEVAEAVVAQARAVEEYTRIRAPFDGVITHRTYHEGDFIRDASSGATKPVLIIARTDLMRVIVDVPDPDVPYTHRGDPAVVRVDALPDHPLQGKVARTAGSEDYNSRTMRTEIDLPNPKDLLANGMFGSVTIHLGKTRTGLTIPSAALVGDEKDGQRSVYVVKGGKAHRVTVRVGLDDGIRAEALSSLKADDQVIVRHGPGLTEGAPVEVAEGPKK
jgi:HlyD family secretion protein